MTKHAEDLAKLGWQYFECPACSSEGARAFPKPEHETQAYCEAARLAQWLFKTHYAQEEHYASGRVVWGLCDTTAGVISQIDNMVCKLVLPKEPEQEPVALVKEMRDVQGQHGNWNYDPYMQGLYNGLEFAVSLLERREPQFKDAPETWIGDIRIKRDKFNSTEPIEAAHGIKEKNT